MAKWHRQQAGFVTKHKTIGLQTWMMVGVELSSAEFPRQMTRLFCHVIPNRRANSFKKIMLPRLSPNSLVWTDQHSSYEWLGREGHFHESVNHLRGEFSRPRGYTRARRKPKVTFAPIYRARGPGHRSEAPALAPGPGIQERGWLVASTEDASADLRRPISDAETETTENNRSRNEGSVVAAKAGAIIL